MTEKLQSQMKDFQANAGQKLTLELELDGIIIEVVDLTTLEPDPQNAMAHPEPNRSATRTSLRLHESEYRGMGT
jgi:hypothetical protein